MDFANAPGHWTEGDGNVACSRVGYGRPDGASDNKSVLKPSLFPCLLLFSLWCLFTQVVRRQSTLRFFAGTGGRVHPTDRPRERLSGACPELDAGRSLHRARLEGGQPEGQCVWNTFKVAVHGRAEAIRRYENIPWENYELLRMLPQWSGVRLVFTAGQINGATSKASSRTRRCSQTLTTVKTPPQQRHPAQKY